MFPGPTLQAAMTRVVEAALEQALALDPAGRQGLLGALDAPVLFRFEGIGLHLSLRAVAGRVQVGSTAPEDAAMIVSGPPLAFAALAQGDPAVFSEQRLRVDGDMGRAHALQRALDRLDPDWEAALARYTGDVPAHFIGRRVRGALHWQKQAFASLNANLDEYIHEESRTLPGRNELSATFDDIDRTRLQVDRLAARIERLQAQLDADTTSPSEPS
ncbi:ubiquinone biosynthesis accessory factor UbiJ [Marinobacter sp. JSM 1782161]|uniref:ubiquinone biosynthesis accessory factor UbiJ n=1 Tax=Marinobacter sp. JSM 1782161 TaxID=2685906 RepID=UPI001403D2F2|nr:SCP2 sterol-binding domain-containing protein [Marinobacter sp. JSM 1782161]